jgi:hypothetical protein
MVKLVQCVTRRPHLRVEEFRAAWDAYGDRLRAAAAGLGATRVTLSTRLETPLNEAMAEAHSSALPYDGVAEIAWPSGRAVVAGAALPGTRERIERVRATQEEFVDAAHSAFFFVHEQVLFDEHGSTGG